MLVNSNSILIEAFKKSYAIPAYNVNNMEWAKYILEACNDDRSPVILAFTESSIRYIGGYKASSNMVKSLIDDLKINIPVILHLDHAHTYESCKKAIDVGFTSVMIDGSELNLEENIKLTNKVSEYAKKHQVSVEAEIGKIGKNNDECTNFEDASLFAVRTDIDSLSLSIGNVHGFYESEPKLNFELLGAVGKETRIPLVLHGGSFLDKNKIRTAIFCGVCKININTELQYAWASAVKKYLQYNKTECDPRKIIGAGEEELKKVIHEKNNLFGSKNRAN